MEGLPTHIITIVRDPLTRMVSLMRKKQCTIFDYTAHEDYYKVLAKWEDVYSEPFIKPFTVVGKLGILKFELLSEAVPLMLEWLGIQSDVDFPHMVKTDPRRPPIERDDEERIRKMYDGKYAKHFGYEYHA